MLDRLPVGNDPSIPRDVVFCANRMTTKEFEAVGFRQKAEELRKNFKFVREMPPSKQKDKLMRWWQKEHLNVFNELMATEFSDPLPKKFRKHAVK